MVSQLIYKNSNEIKQLREKLKRTELENRDDCSLRDYEQLALKIYIIGICCFSTNYAALRPMTSWLGIRIICPSEATYLSADCCFSDRSKILIRGEEHLEITIRLKEE